MPAKIGGFRHVFYYFLRKFQNIRTLKSDIYMPEMNY